MFFLVKLGIFRLELGKIYFLTLGMGPISAPKSGDREPCVTSNGGETYHHHTLPLFIGKALIPRLAIIDRSICILTRIVVITGFNQSLLVD